MNHPLCVQSEFTGWDNWDFTNADDPSNEFELFDLDADPFETSNQYTSAPSNLKLELHARLEKLYRCRGTENCN